MGQVLRETGEFIADLVSQLSGVANNQPVHEFLLCLLQLLQSGEDKHSCRKAEEVREAKDRDKNANFEASAGSNTYQSYPFRTWPGKSDLVPRWLVGYIDVALKDERHMVR